MANVVFQSKFFTLMGASALCLGLAAAPAFAELAASPRQAENKAILISRQDPGTLDYVINNLTALRLWIPANVVEPLVVFETDGTALPGMAESWEISEDGKTYTFKIREANFHDGAPVTMEDVVYSLETMRTSPVVANASPYAAVETITALDDRHVQVTLSRPSQSFWQGMGTPSSLIQPKAAEGSRATKPIGTGPYTLVEYVANSHIRFAANPNYWGEAPALSEITVRLVADGTAGLNAMEAVDVDANPVITIDLWEQIVKRGLDKNAQLHTFPQGGEPTFAVINQKIDPGIRQTIAAVLDRQQFNDAFGAPWGAENTCTFALPHQSWYVAESTESCPYPYDFEGAMAKVAAEGYGATELSYASLTDVPDLSLPADIMVPMMQAAGFNVKRDAMDLARYAQLIFQGRPPQFDVTIMAGDANPMQFVCTDEAQAGWSTYCSPAYAEAISRADEATSKEAYDAAMAEAAKVLRDDAVIVPLLAKLGVGLYHPNLKGFGEPRVGVAVEFARLSW